MVNILSWNTLCYDDVWSIGWGCPLEIQRRDTLLQIEDSMDVEDAQQLLTQERYDRIRQSVVEEIQRPDRMDFMLFQELTYDDPWDITNDDTTFTSLFETTYERISCQDSLKGNLQRVYVHKQSSWKPIRSYDLVSSILEGGCLIEFVYIDVDNYDYDEETIQLLCDDNKYDDYSEIIEEEDDDDLMNFCNTIQNNKLYIVNLHGDPNGMRNPIQLQNGMIELWNEIEQLLINSSTKKQQQQQQNNNNHNDTDYIDDDDDNDDEDSSELISWKDRIILCGDWNTQLSDLSLFSSSWDNISIGLLDNTTGMNFSTNHEYGFIAQYDGCIFSSSLKLNGVKRNTTGFMIKGQNGQGW